MTTKKIQSMSLSELRELAIRRKIIQAKTLNKVQLLEKLSRSVKKTEPAKAKNKPAATKKSVKGTTSAKKTVKKTVTLC